MTPIEGGAAVEVWLPGMPARPLTVHADFGGDSFRYGAIFPRLSPDGKWLAYRRGGAVYLRHVDTAEELTVVEHPADRVELRLAGWAPEGGALLLHLAGFNRDSGSLPRGVKTGFYIARADGLPPVRLPQLPGFLAWLSDGSAMVYADAGSAGGTTLMQLAVDPGAKPTPLHTIAGEDGFVDLAAHGDEVVYVHDRAIIRSALDGSGRATLVGPGQNRQYARPRPSPDGARVAYLDERTVKVLARAATVATTVDECETLRCTFTWENDAALLVVDAGVLRRVTLDGARTRIADGVFAVAVAGE